MCASPPHGSSDCYVCYVCLTTARVKRLLCVLCLLCVYADLQHLLQYPRHVIVHAELQHLLRCPHHVLVHVQVYRICSNALSTCPDAGPALDTLAAFYLHLAHIAAAQLTACDAATSAGPAAGSTGVCVCLCVCVACEPTVSSSVFVFQAL
jgi:hypothetical protein